MEFTSDGLKTSFLNGVIEEEVYIEKPHGFEVHPRETHVCRLKKALYGLKQAPRAWYARIDRYLTRFGFSKSHADPNLYYKVVNNAADSTVICWWFVLNRCCCRPNTHLLAWAKSCSLSVSLEAQYLGSKPTLSNWLGPLPSRLTPREAKGGRP